MALGLFGASFVRPHLALLALVAFVTGADDRGDATTSGDTMTPSFLAKIVGLVLVLVHRERARQPDPAAPRHRGLQLVVDRDRDAPTSASKTAVGDSTFTPPNPRSPTGFVEATVTVLFRPFPIEARGSEQILTRGRGDDPHAILTATSFRRLLTIPRRLRAQPYVMFALAYVLLWILAFGVIANFGILARQRTQMLPFYFVLLSVAAVVAKTAPARRRPLGRRRRP